MLKPKPLTIVNSQQSIGDQENQLQLQDQKWNHQADEEVPVSPRSKKTTNHQNGASELASSNKPTNNRSFDSVNTKSPLEEFDFEKNLALFDKNAFYEEINNHNINYEWEAQNHSFHSTNSSNSSVVAGFFSSRACKSQSNNNLSNNTRLEPIGETQTANKNYRFDEMILDTGDPVNFEQIKVGLLKLYFNILKYSFSIKVEITL